MISENELIEDPVRQFEQNFTGRQAMIWTALPGIIQSLASHSGSTRHGNRQRGNFESSAAS